MLTQDKAHELFRYDDGVLYWRVKPSRKFRAGDPVGSQNDLGYLRTTINYKPYRVHRIIFLMHHGWMPSIIDHVDGDKTNNRIENLRPATTSQNGMNSVTRTDNTSGVKGVCWHKGSQSWRVVIHVDGKQTTFGYHKDKDKAIALCAEVRAKHHGEFAKG